MCEQSVEAEQPRMVRVSVCLEAGAAVCLRREGEWLPYVLFDITS